MKQNVDIAKWLIFVFPWQMNIISLFSMNEPGSVDGERAIGKDVQGKHIKNYEITSSDNDLTQKY